MKKEMLINVLQPEECRIAIVEDGILEELYVERTSLESYTGNIYKGKVVNLEPAIQAAFIDFSVGRNGFLHVSDVEPQYYHRHLSDDAELGARDKGRDPRREREEPRPPRSEERGERDRDRDRDRPDRSERGRREPRRFGEGLVEEPWGEPPAPVRPAPPLREEPERPSRPVEAREPERLPRLPEAQEPRGVVEENPSFGWSDAPPPRRADRQPRAVEPEEPRMRQSPPADSGDADLPDLPPSRTGRRTAAPRPVDRDLAEPARPRAPAAMREPEPEPEPELESEPEPSASAEPRRGRGGRGRGGRPPRELEARVDIEPEAIEALDADPIAGDLPEPAPRRAGGRAAIRSRGGEREPARPKELAPERPADILPERPRPPEIERPRAPEPERPRVEIERPRAEVERPRAAEPERTRSRPREAEPRGRAPEAEPARDRPKTTHTRAGEPGYVPRRERSRPAGAPEVEPVAFDWLDLEPSREREEDPDAEAADSESEVDTQESGKVEGPRRRRRRRGRRRDREPEVASADDELDADGEGDEDQDHEVMDGGDTVVIDGPLTDNFDFGDEDEDDEVDEDDDEDDDDVAGPARVATALDDRIDPELEEEIRREIEEIAELEREMGLRGTTEARPRRGDEPSAPGDRARAPRGRGTAKPPLQEIFRRGDEVLVQVIKESIGTKGPTLSTYISIPGRYLVLMPGLNRVGVSRKIADEGQRRKLREIMTELNPPKGLGFIVRTAGLDRTKRELARDLAYLLRLWKVILRRIKKAKAPAPIYQESDMITRTIRDIFTAEIDTIWIDEPQAFERAQEFLRVVMPKFVDRLKLHQEKVPLFHKYGLEEEIAKIQRRQVPLPEGGSIVIDQTEALVAIDVNSGNFRVENDAERTAYEMNLRAAKEIARQLRLRDLGGVIVNDFIDMRDERNRRGVERALRDAIKRDRARTKVLRMSQFGLIEMTRQRIRPSLKRSVYEDCPHCRGAAVVKTVESMSIDVMRLLALAVNRDDVRRVNIIVSAEVSAFLNNRKRRELTRLETEANMTVQIRHEEEVPAEHLLLECFDGQNNEVRLLPPAVPPARRGR